MTSARRRFNVRWVQYALLATSVKFVVGSVTLAYHF